MTAPQQPEPIQLPPTNSNSAALALIIGSISVAAACILIGPLLGVAAITLGIIALARIRQSQGQLLGRKKAITGIILGFVSIPLTVITIIGVFVLLLLPAKEQARETMAQANMHMMALAITTYSSDNSDYMPPDFTSLYLDGSLGGPLPCVDPRSGKTRPSLSPTMSRSAITAEINDHCDFVYTWPWAPAAATPTTGFVRLMPLPPTEIVLFDIIPSKRGIIALFADGHVEVLSRPNFDAALDRVNTRRTALGLRPLPAPTFAASR